MPSTPVKHKRIVTPWVTPLERKACTRELYHKGYKLCSIALKFDCNVQTVRRDLSEAGLPTWSNISDSDLDALIIDIIGVAHKAVGLSKVVSYLKHPKRGGHRVQQQRVKNALVRFKEMFNVHRGPCAHAMVFVAPLI